MNKWTILLFILWIGIGILNTIIGVTIYSYWALMIVFLAHLLISESRNEIIEKQHEVLLEVHEFFNKVGEER